MLNNPAYEKMTAAEAKQVQKLRDIIMASQLPSRELDENLLIATFNIREFGAKGKTRKAFAINALAEICSCFDIIALQELRADLRDLDRMLTVMGPYWKVLFNDPAGKALNKGNDERLAFVYDSRVIKFSGLAAELMITDDFFGSDSNKASMPWRTPYMASFRAGFFDFALLTVHIQWNEKAEFPHAPRKSRRSLNGLGSNPKPHNYMSRTYSFWEISIYLTSAALRLKRLKQTAFLFQSKSSRSQQISNAMHTTTKLPLMPKIQNAPWARLALLTTRKRFSKGWARKSSRP
ncbi:MAG: hypothetical protein EXR11_09070 [Rhodospirillaceae bacterium]|nr:hypothetical protein [Rhodospirillaceae bacterium]